MKSREEILNKAIDESGFDYDTALKAMKIYAEQAIDRCGEITRQLIDASRKPIHSETLKSAMIGFVKNELK